MSWGLLLLIEDMCPHAFWELLLFLVEFFVVTRAHCSRRVPAPQKHPRKCSVSRAFSPRFAQARSRASVWGRTANQYELPLGWRSLLRGRGKAERR